jgi:hypothetical protein
MRYSATFFPSFTSPSRSYTLRTPNIITLHLWACRDDFFPPLTNCSHPHLTRENTASPQLFSTAQPPAMPRSRAHSTESFVTPESSPRASPRTSPPPPPIFYEGAATPSIFSPVPPNTPVPPEACWLPTCDAPAPTVLLKAISSALFEFELVAGTRLTRESLSTLIAAAAPGLRAHLRQVLAGLGYSVECVVRVFSPDAIVNSLA